MNEILKANIAKFVEQAGQPKAAGILDGIPFVDSILEQVVAGLKAVSVAASVIIEWVPQIAVWAVTTTKSVKDIVDEILSKIGTGA